MTVTFLGLSGIDNNLFKYAVIISRYNGQWVFCRHKERETWEVPGGHREQGENIFTTAKRELREETGAIDFTITPVNIYIVKENNISTYGMLYFADIKKLGTLPEESEISEIKLFNTLPDKTMLTYPDIQHHLYYNVQNWLNLQSSPDELWDIYDENRNLTGRVHRRGDPLLKGDYHLSVHIWLQNKDGEFLITKRSPNKGYPNMWETTGGSALAGDDSLSTAIREVYEETGLHVNAENGECIMRQKRENDFCDIWIFRQNFNLGDVVLQENETCAVKYASREDILKMRAEKTFIPFDYLDDFLEKTNQLNI